jgi:hypothetical protein
MMRAMIYPFKDYVRATGWKTYLLQILVHDSLGALILFFVMNPSLVNQWEWEPLARSFVYFIPYFSVLAGLSSFENEHFAGISEDLAQRPWQSYLSRAPMIVAQTAIPLSFFSSLIWWHLPNPGILLLFLFGYWLVFSLLSVFFVLRFGFVKEKSINNAVNFVPWILALGPGPFLSQKGWPWISFFPGCSLFDGAYAVEALKLFTIVLIALALARSSFKSRTSRLYRLG